MRCLATYENEAKRHAITHKIINDSNNICRTLPGDAHISRIHSPCCGFKICVATIDGKF